MLSSMSKLQAVDTLGRLTEAPPQRFVEGTNEIEKTVIARTILGAACA